MLQFCSMSTILLILLVNAANFPPNWNLIKTCFICRSVLLHKFIGDPPWSALCSKLHYIAACCRLFLFFLRVLCLLCCVLFTFVYSCLCAVCFVCIAWLGAWFDDLAVPRPITINFTSLQTLSESFDSDIYGTALYAMSVPVMQLRIQPSTVFQHTLTFSTKGRIVE